MKVFQTLNYFWLHFCLVTAGTLQSVLAFQRMYELVNMFFIFYLCWCSNKLVESDAWNLIDSNLCATKDSVVLIIKSMTTWWIRSCLITVFTDGMRSSLCHFEMKISNPSNDGFPFGNSTHRTAFKDSSRRSLRCRCGRRRRSENASLLPLRRLGQYG